jgi:hypothetical protein
MGNMGLRGGTPTPPFIENCPNSIENDYISRTTKIHVIKKYGILFL